MLGSIASGLALGLLLVLAVFGGGEEAEITGSALLALGAGFILLAVGSVRFTDQPQRWALAPGVAAAVVGLVLLALSPGDHILGLAGWVWPALHARHGLRDLAPERAGRCTSLRVVTARAESRSDRIRGAADGL